MQLLAICAFIAFCFLGCFLDNPVEETPEPTEIEYCHWLLEELYFWDMPKNSKSFTKTFCTIHKTLCFCGINCKWCNSKKHFYGHSGKNMLK